MSPPHATGKAHEAMTYFTLLYHIEKQARIQRSSPDVRKQLRQTEAVPVLEGFHRWLINAKSQVPPASAIGKALDCTLKQWPCLMKYVYHGKVEVDTHWVENQLRPLVLGRRNWLFVAHEQSTHMTALLDLLRNTIFEIFSPVESKDYESKFFFRNKSIL